MTLKRNSYQSKYSNLIETNNVNKKIVLFISPIKEIVFNILFLTN